MSWLCEKCSNTASPLHLAARNGHESCVQHLLNNHSMTLLCALDQTTGWSPMHWAVYYAHLGIMELLRTANASTESVTRSKQSYWHVAAYAGKLKSLEWLARHYPASINSVDQLGNTALHLAATCGYFDCVRFLALAGAALEVKNHDHSTARDMAIRHQRQPCVDLLDFLINEMALEQCSHLALQDQNSNQPSPTSNPVSCKRRHDDDCIMEDYKRPCFVQPHEHSHNLAWSFTFNQPNFSPQQ